MASPKRVADKTSEEVSPLKNKSRRLGMYFILLFLYFFFLT